MKRFISRLLALGLFAGVGFTARAVPISLDASSSIHWFDFAATPTNPQIAAAAGVSLSALGVRLYQADSDSNSPSGSEQGPLAGSYSSTFMPANGTGNVTLSWDGDQWGNATYFLAKDGNEGSYLWDISGWNGKNDIFLTSPFSAGKTISYIAFFGPASSIISSTLPSHGVPDSGNPAIMLGLIVAAVALATRYLRP